MLLPLDKGARGIFQINIEMPNPKELVPQYCGGIEHL